MCNYWTGGNLTINITNNFYTVVQKSKSEMTDAERKRMQAEINKLQKTVSVSKKSRIVQSWFIFE